MRRFATLLLLLTFPAGLAAASPPAGTEDLAEACVQPAESPVRCAYLGRYVDNAGSVCVRVVAFSDSRFVWACTDHADAIAANATFDAWAAAPPEARNAHGAAYDAATSAIREAWPLVALAQEASPMDEQCYIRPTSHTCVGFAGGDCEGLRYFSYSYDGDVSGTYLLVGTCPYRDDVPGSPWRSCHGVYLDEVEDSRAKSRTCYGWHEDTGCVGTSDAPEQCTGYHRETGCVGWLTRTPQAYPPGASYDLCTARLPSEECIGTSGSDGGTCHGVDAGQRCIGQAQEVGDAPQNHGWCTGYDADTRCVGHSTKEYWQPGYACVLGATLPQKIPPP